MFFGSSWLLPNRVGSFLDLVWVVSSVRMCVRDFPDPGEGDGRGKGGKRFGGVHLVRFLPIQHNRQVFRYFARLALSYLRYYGYF